MLVPVFRKCNDEVLEVCLKFDGEDVFSVGNWSPLYSPDSRRPRINKNEGGDRGGDGQGLSHSQCSSIPEHAVIFTGLSLCGQVMQAWGVEQQWGRTIIIPRRVTEEYY